MIRIVESFYVKSAIEPADYPASAYPEFAFAGRSNVGKSTLINLITNHHGLAKTSGTPGKTRLLNFFLLRWKQDEPPVQGFLQVTDLPGYGFADISLAEQEKWRKMISKYLEQREQLRSIIVLVDIRHPADGKDVLMLELLRLRNIDHCVVATKADKIPKTKIARTLAILHKGLGLRDETMFAVSSLKNTGFEPLLAWIYERLN
ncbi:MAG: ribosome biogenesis GTP-binding protein YihA/YsxC [Candidatus Cloacimonadaceae bacterium]|nr:ribosome biogenesis GTP-binding protein YihA/YsxC [Candidatus Cloacimonadaceae bacterium]MDP3113337.1 ribosome biogenesis GTP-binding protein YihA/YsxC [Candidatus Cloacimonadaceae bacterium]